MPAKTNVRTLTNDGLDRALAETCGWRKSHIEFTWYSPNNRELRSAPPRFSRSFDALLAIKDRDGFDGPVACMPFSQRLEFVEWLAWLFTTDGGSKIQPNWWIISLPQKGPRPLAEACLVALEPEKYEMGEAA